MGQTSSVKAVGNNLYRLREVAHADEVWAVAFQPAPGELIATGCKDLS